MKKYLLIFSIVGLCFLCCCKTDNSLSTYNPDKAKQLEQNDNYVPWWKK